MNGIKSRTISNDFNVIMIAAPSQKIVSKENTNDVHIVAVYFPTYALQKS